MGFSHVAAADHSDAYFSHIPTFQMVLQPVANLCYRAALSIVNRAYFIKLTGAAGRPQREGLSRIFCQPAFDIGLHCFDHRIHMGIFKEMPSAFNLLMGYRDTFLLM
jgi:hypothetical protein